MTRHAQLGPAIPDDSAPVPPAHRPTRWTVRRVRGIGMVFLGLAVALSLLSTLVAYRVTQDAAQRARESQQQAAAVERRLSALEDYVGGKGAQRDAETKRQNEQFARFVCDVLDQLPSDSAALDPIRAEYGCGPGLDTAAASAPNAVARSTAAPSTPAPQSAPAASTAATPPASSTPPTSPTAPATEPTSAAPPSPSPQPSGLGGVLCTALPIIC